MDRLRRRERLCLRRRRPHEARNDRASPRRAGFAPRRGGRTAWRGAGGSREPRVRRRARRPGTCSRPAGAPPYRHRSHSISKIPRSTILIRFLTWEEVGRDGEGGEGFEEVEPGGEDREGRQGCEISEEARSLFGRFSGSLPGRLDEVEHGAPSEGEHVEGGAPNESLIFPKLEKAYFRILGAAECRVSQLGDRCGRGRSDLILFMNSRAASSPAIDTPSTSCLWPMERSRRRQSVHARAAIPSVPVTRATRADAQRGENLGEGCAGGGLRLPRLPVRGPCPSSERPEVSGREPIAENPETDQDQDRRTAGEGEQSAQALSERTTQPRVDRLVGLFQLRLLHARLSDRRSTRQGLFRRAAQGGGARRATVLGKAIFGELGVHKLDRRPRKAAAVVCREICRKAGCEKPVRPV